MEELSPNGFLFVFVEVAGIFAHILTNTKKKGIVPESLADICTVHGTFPVVVMEAVT